MAQPLEFYFDFSSAYGYLAATKIEAIGARHGRTVTWRPILLGAVFKLTRGQPLPSVPLKGAYSRHDFARSARLLGVPYQAPSKFPIAGQTPSRAFYWVADQDAAAAKRLALALYRAFFVDDRDISEPAVTVEVAGELGIDKARLAQALDDTAVKDRLRREVDAAIGQGVFGSPYIVVDGEPFWGHDRRPQIERWLEQGPF